MNGQNLPLGWATTKLGDVHRDDSRTTDPRKYPQTIFELWSVPSHASGEPESLVGGAIGSTKQTVEPGTVLLSGINPRLNRVWVVEPRSSRPVIASTEWIPFFPLPNLSPKYLAFFLQQHSVRDFLASRASGVGGSLTRVKANVAAEIDFPVAPEAEQKRIVATIEALFTDLDAASKALERTQANLKRYRASVLKAACGGRLVPTEAELARKEGRPYESGEELLKRILVERRAKWEADQLAKMAAAGKPPQSDDWKRKYREPEALDDNNLPELPEGWTWARAEQVCHFITKGTTPSAPKLHNGEGDVPFIKVYNLTDRGVLDFSVNPTFIDCSTHELELARSLVLPGDVLMNIVGPPLGKVSLVPDTHAEWNINQAIAIFRALPGLNRRYLMYLLLCDDILRRAVLAAKATAGQFNLTLEICRDLPLPIAPSAEQARIAAELDKRVSSIEATASTGSATLSRADRLRQSILKRAFEGKLVPQDPDDEPASVLLERIRSERGPAVNQRASGKCRSRVLSTGA